MNFRGTSLSLQKQESTVPWGHVARRSAKLPYFFSVLGKRVEIIGPKIPAPRLRDAKVKAAEGLSSYFDSRRLGFIRNCRPMRIDRKPQIEISRKDFVVKLRILCVFYHTTIFFFFFFNSLLIKGVVSNWFDFLRNQTKPNQANSIRIRNELNRFDWQFLFLFFFIYKRLIFLTIMECQTHFYYCIITLNKLTQVHVNNSPLR